MKDETDQPGGQGATCQSSAEWHKTARTALFWRGYALTVLPLLALIAPFFCYRSATPDWWGYSRSYALGLLVATGGSLGFGLLVGSRCSHRGKLYPAFKFLVPVGVMGCAALATEIVLRIAEPDSFSEYRKNGCRKSVIFGFELAPQISFEQFHTDQFGFRVNLNTPTWYEKHGGNVSAVATGAAAGDELLGFALGESSVFGAGLKDNETWPHFLELKLRQSGHPVTVVNAGNSGHSSLQTLLRLYLRVVPQRPDFVIYYAAYNDVSRQPLRPDALPIEDAVVFSDSMAGYVRLRNARQNPYCHTLLYYHLTYTLPKQVVSWLLGPDGYDQLRGMLKHEDAHTRGSPIPWAQTFRALKNVRKAAQQGVRVEEDHKDWAETIAHNGQHFVQNVQLMADVCRRNHIRFVLTTFLCDEQRILPYRRQSIAYYNDLLRRLARDEGLDLIDLQAILAAQGDTKQIFAEDHYHPNPAGAELIADTLSKTFPVWGRVEPRLAAAEPNPSLAGVDPRETITPD